MKYDIANGRRKRQCDIGLVSSGIIDLKKKTVCKVDKIVRADAMECDGGMGRFMLSIEGFY